MTSIFLKGAPISFILLLLAVYVLGAFLYFLFFFRRRIELSAEEQKWEEIFLQTEDSDDILSLAIPRLRSGMRHIQLLRLTVNIAPLLGLLGTILGIVRSTGGLVINDQNALLLGISQSLVTTAMGLIVSVPALLVHFLGKTSLENQIVQVKQQFYRRRME